MKTKKYKEKLTDVVKKAVKGVKDSAKLVELEVKVRKLELENANLRKKLKDAKYRFETISHQCKQYIKDM